MKRLKTFPSKGRPQAWLCGVVGFPLPKQTLDFFFFFDEFGDCSWDLCHAHTPCPPAALQSRSELLFGGVYPVAGGLSGNCFRNPPRAILKASRVVWLFTSLGRMFQRRVALTPNELSYAVDMDFCAL